MVQQMTDSLLCRYSGKAIQEGQYLHRYGNIVTTTIPNKPHQCSLGTEEYAAESFIQVHDKVIQLRKSL